MEISGYTIISELGRGGMATVYLANQDRLHRQVALKVMRPIEGAVDDFTERFIKEGQIIAQLQHRAIVTIYDFNSYEDIRYFSMEYLPSGTLAERIEQGLSIKETLFILRSIAEALSYAHERGIIHRDLKPQNIMFRDDGTPVLTDFGIARVVNANSDTTRLTRFGMAIGSPRYMSPEQITGQTVDARADLYSLGIVFYEMLTKTLPYHADDAISLAMMHCTSPMPPLTGEAAPFQAILEKLTAKKADDRFADATQFIQAIDEADNWSHTQESSNDETRIFQSSRSVNQLQSSTTDRSRKRIAISSLLFLLIAVAVAIYLMLIRSPKPPGPEVSIELPPATDGRSATAANYEKLAIAHFHQGELKRSMELINLGLSVTPGDSRLEALRTRVQVDLDVSELVKKAEKLAEEGSLERSLELVRQALDLTPGRNDLLAMRDDMEEKLRAVHLRQVDQVVEQARGLRHEGELTESLKLIVSGLEIIPDHAGLLDLRTQVQQDIQTQAEVADLLSEARALLQSDQIDESLARVEKGLQMDSENPELQNLRASIAERQLERRNVRADELLEQARTLHHQGDPGRSLELVEDGLLLVPTNSDLQSLRDTLVAEIGQQQLIDELFAQAQAQVQQGALEESLKLIERGLQLSPQHTGFKDLKSDIEKQYAQLHQNRADEFLSQAREQQRRGFLNKAMELVESGLQEMPTDTALLNLKQAVAEQIKIDRQVAQLIVDVQTLADEGSTAKGLSLVQRGLELAPSNAQLKELERSLVAQRHLAQVQQADELLEQATRLHTQRNLRESLTVVEEGIKLAPTHPGLLTLRQKITEELDQRDHIDRLFGECSNRYPLGPPLRDTAEAAVACYQEVLELDPRNTAARSKQEEIADRLPDWIRGLLQADDLGKADSLLKLLLRIAPQHTELAALRKARAAAQEGHLALDLSQRRLVQTWLNALGYAVGDPDGAFGTKTRQAISAYQSAVNMETTGFLDADAHALLEEQGSAKLRRAILPEMADLKGGCFQMGSPITEAARDEDERQHEVCVEGFRLGKREITVKEFRRFVEATDYQTDAERNAWGDIGCWALDAQDTEGHWSYRAWANWRKPNKYQKTREDHPVACVSWNDAQAYVEWLSRESGAAIRLPTEAEWEYAARAGTTGTRFWGNEQDQAACNFASVADQGHQWADGFPCDDGHDWVAPVGERQPNGWGLYDIFGNVWEWTCSAYDREYVGKEAACSTNIEAPRVLRGGSWYSGPPAVRAAYRDRNYLGTRYSFLGFRIVED